MKKFILAIDQGTTSSRAILFDHQGKYTYSAQREVQCIYPNEGWVEEDPIELWVSELNSHLGNILLQQRNILEKLQVLQLQLLLKFVLEEDP